MASIHHRKLIAALVKELKQRDSILEQLEGRIVSLERMLNNFRVDVKQKIGAQGKLCNRSRNFSVPEP
jgi:hypothetical protein